MVSKKEKASWAKKIVIKREMLKVIKYGKYRCGTTAKGGRVVAPANFFKTPYQYR